MGRARYAADADVRPDSKTFAEALMGAEADAICEAPYGQPSEDRVNYRGRRREGEAGHQRYWRIIVLRKRDVPVPPVLIATCPVLVNPAVTIGRRERRTLRVHIHSSATSLLNT